MEESCYYVFFAFFAVLLTFQMPHLNEATATLATDQSALLTLKTQITSDPHHTLARNWTNSSSVCNWIGITCSSRHQRVTALNLSHMSLSGTLPPQLGNLSFLASLDLKNNLFGGALPRELSLLRRLKFMSLELNNFTGDIPPLFEHFPRLEFLSLSNNSFTGSIPKSIANLSNLQILDLTSNSLSGEIPMELGRLKSLRYLWIESNHFSGAIPSAVFNISTLLSVALSSNELSGSLPTDMCRDNQILGGIFLSYNQLSGPIPTNLSRCSNLQYLSMSYNSFSGHIPADIGYLPSLQALALGGNNLNGTLPHEIGNLQNLVLFAVEKNQIAGSNPLNIFLNMSSLQTLLLWRNKFMGKLSRYIGNLTMLTSLELEDNYFTGVIPREIGQLYQLEELRLELNTLSGSIPRELFNISTLRTLSLSANALSGLLPSNLCHGSPVLEELLLSMNLITGPIPSSISNCSQLRLLALGTNNLSGYVPNDLGKLRLLQRLQLFSNNLTSAPQESSFITSLTNCRFLTELAIDSNPLGGVIPASIGNLSSSLRLFYAHTCNFSGTIPLHVGNLSNLVTFDLLDNELSGNIPITIKHLHKLQGLLLDDNMLGGSIPEAICGLPSLNSIYMSRNQFYGPIPECLGNVSTLMHIFLDSNMLTSSIPSSLWGLKALMNLDLSSNSLSGLLPQEMNLVAVIYMNLSMNHLSESIPSTIGKLQNLVNLSLAHNRLEGSIPVSVGSMLSLVTLDFSYNNLSGSIPKSLEVLQHLDFFNVSFNMLSGEIPTGGPFRNFTMDSFKGNDALCGIPRYHVRICPIVSNHRAKRKKVEKALFIAFGVVGFIAVVSLAFILVRYKRKDKITSRADGMVSTVPERVSYYEILHATDHFNESNLLGTGSSCSVYRGVLKDGKNIAVKVFNMQLEGISRMFDVECEILRNIRHRNLTSVISSCSNEEFKALVLEYMPRGSLERWLYSHNYCLDAVQRLNIMIDVASALEYLHHGYSTPIVHSDLKPSNVLLDEDMVGHVSDFGIAKMLGNGDSFELTNTLATLGYIAPEYGLEGLVSTRCDVYSYGVMLMETFTRKRPSDEMFGGDLSLRSWVEISVPEEVIDANLLMNVEEKHFGKNLQCIASILELALKCCARLPGERCNMKEALVELHKIKRRFSTNL